MSQASNTIYGDILTTETLAAMKRRLTTREYAMTRLWNLSKYATKGVKQVMIPNVTVESGQEVAVGSAFTTPSGASEGTTDLDINRKAGNPFDVKRDVAQQTKINLIKEKGVQSGDNILEKMDIAILAGVIAAVPVPAKKDFAGASENANTVTEDDFINARTYLNEKKAPKNGRFCLIGPGHEGQLFKIDSFISADKIGQQTGMPIKEGFIGRLLGFDVISLNHIPKVDKAGAINETSAKNDSYPIIFGHELSYAWAKQLTETLEETNVLATSDRMVPYTTYGHQSVVTDYLYQVSDKTTADPT